MKSKSTRFVPVRLSLADLAGEDYVEAVLGACAALDRAAEKALRARAYEPHDFFPRAFQKRLLDHFPNIGTRIAKPLKGSAAGAGTAGFAGPTKVQQAPLSGLGYFRVGENGRLYFTAKSEHYHAPLGHRFPGYALIDLARSLGVPNATHNNTRGHLTRTLEEALVRAAAGLAPNARVRLRRLIDAERPDSPNRVLNLETGSLAAEAALKMVLARFYRPQPDSPRPKYEGRVPVIVVIGDYEGGERANYHGTTILTQLMRGMWTDLREGMEAGRLFMVRSVRPEHVVELQWVFDTFDKGKYKIAGVFHEFVLMNYGGKRLSEEFVRQLYALARGARAPVVADEIQSGVWSPKLFMFREYGVMPAFVAIGKGFPGGEYPASRLLFSSEYDALPQFGALVTNGQEELASLAYLVTMRWAEANAEITASVGEYYEGRLRELATRHPGLIASIEGRRHLAGVYFHDLAPAAAFAQACNKAGLDISVQTYKAGCPPSALTKLPLIAGYEAVDMLVSIMQRVLAGISAT